MGVCGAQATLCVMGVGGCFEKKDIPIVVKGCLLVQKLEISIEDK
jgi:hypothetical protein